MLSTATLSEIRDALATAHGQRLRGVVLFGSEARGNAQPDSDIDLLVLLESPIRYLPDLELNVAATYPIERRLGRAISAKPVSVEQFGAEDSPLMSDARREGVRL